MAKTSDLRLLLNNEQRALLRKAAYHLGVREQEVARGAVLSVLGASGEIPIAKPSDDLVKSLHALQRKLAAALAEVEDLLARIDRRDDGEDDTDAELDEITGDVVELTAEVGEDESVAGSAAEGRGKAVEETGPTQGGLTEKKAPSSATRKRAAR